MNRVEMSLGRGDDGWDRYVEQHPDGTCDHLWRWREIFQGVFGHECAYLTAHRDGTIVGVLPLVRFKSRLFGRFLVSVPFLNYGGVLASDPEAAAALLEYARETGRAFGASHVEFRHRARQYDELPFRQHKIGMRLDLPQSADVLWNRVDRKIRNQVRKAQKEQLTVDDGGAELVDDFYAVFATNMRDLGTPVYAKSLFAETLRAFPDRARVHVVRREGRPVAAGVTIACAQTVLVPWASSLREFRHLSPNMLLYWRMLEYSIGRGASVFDFGRSSPGGGTHHFKQQWGAVETPLHWEYVLLNRSAPPDQGPGNPRFSLAIEAWKRLPLWVANAVGPRVVRNVP